MSKPILCLDFDGVIHSYSSGWVGDITNIPDDPVPGAFEFIQHAIDNGWDVVIHSSRSAQLDGTRAMRLWLRRYSSVLSPQIGISIYKPKAKVTIDDRAITFTGKWPNLEELKKFKPWNKHSV